MEGTDKNVRQKDERNMIMIDKSRKRIQGIVKNDRISFQSAV